MRADTSGREGHAGTVDCARVVQSIGAQILAGSPSTSKSGPGDPSYSPSFRQAPIPQRPTCPHQSHTLSSQHARLAEGRYEVETLRADISAAAIGTPFALIVQIDLPHSYRRVQQGGGRADRSERVTVRAAVRLEDSFRERKTPIPSLYHAPSRSIFGTYPEYGAAL